MLTFLAGPAFIIFPPSSQSHVAQPNTQLLAPVLLRQYGPLFSRAARTLEALVRVPPLFSTCCLPRPCPAAQAASGSVHGPDGNRASRVPPTIPATSARRIPR